MTEPASTADPRRAAHAAVARWRLPFRQHAWRGLSGNWLGAGAGSSLDFQDHRLYLPGDDPRHLHWQAYARTGTLMMKLFRAEVAPFVDIAVDVSASMTFTAAKAARTAELLAFCVECAACANAPARVHLVAGRTVRAVPPDHVRAGRWREQAPADTTPGTAPGPLPWRAGAMKVLISDLLFPGDPSALLTPLAAGNGIGLVFAPALADEAELASRGNVELTDCESRQQRKQRIDEPLAAAYREAYARHFSLWRDACRRRGVRLARVPCEGELTNALAVHAHAAGAVEPGT